MWLLFEMGLFFARFWVRDVDTDEVLEKRFDRIERDEDERQ
jgi:hypothetical protein